MAPADASAGDSADPTTSRDLYNTSAYFSPFYYYGGSTTEAPTGPSVLPGRDRACYAALVACIEAIGLFDSVIFGDPTARPGTGAGAHPLAIVVPRGWEEADDADPVLWVRRVSFTIRVVVRVTDDLAPFDQLDQLASKVQSRVDRADLGDGCLPPLTKIRAGRYAAPNHYPEWSIDLDGEFTIVIAPIVDLLVF